MLDKVEKEVKTNKQKEITAPDKRTINRNRYRFLSEQNQYGCLQRRRNRSFLWLPRSRRRSRFFLYSHQYFFLIFCYHNFNSLCHLSEFLRCVRHGCGVRHREERRGGGVDGSDETGAGNEIDRACRDGWCVGDLRFDYCGYHKYGH